MNQIVAAKNQQAGFLLIGLYGLGIGLLVTLILGTSYPVFLPLGIKVLLAGLLLTGYGLLSGFSSRLIYRPKVVWFAAVGVILLLWLPVVLFGYSTVVGNERYWWLGDDAMISMRYAHNLASGHGLVWNPVEPVEGYTNLLWTLYMGLVHLLPIPLSQTSLVVMLTNILLAIATVPALIRLTRALGGSLPVAVLVVAGFVFNRNELHWATAGFETALLALLFSWAACLIAEESATGQTPRFLTALLIALLALVRADAILLSGLLYVTWILTHWREKQVWLFTAVALIPVAASFGFRYLYYGDLMPNTAYLKTYNWDNRYESGLRYLLSFVAQYALALAFATAGVLIVKKRVQTYLLAAILIYAVYVVYAGGDVFEEFRFFLPVIPVLVALAFTGIMALNRSMTVKVVLGIVCLVSLPLPFPGYSTMLKPREAEIGNLEIARRLKAETPPDSQIADTWAGLVPYFSERYATDLLGKSDPYIARLKPFPGAMAPGHNKFDYTYSLTHYKPDYVISFFTLPPDLDFLKRNSTGDAAFRGQLYFNETFQEHCFPHPVLPGTWRAIFKCEWS